MNISILVATRKRPLLLQRMFDSAIATAKYPDLIEMCVYVDRDDIETQEYLKMMKGNIKITIGERIVLSDMPNKAYKKATADIILIGSDDIMFRTKDWDEIILNIYNEHNDKIILVHGNDLRHRRATHNFLHRRWIETVGYVSPPYFSCDRADAWLEEMANTINRRIFLPNLIIEHMHWLSGKRELDEQDKERMARGKRDDVHGIYLRLTKDRQNDIQKLKNAIGDKVEN